MISADPVITVVDLNDQNDHEFMINDCTVTKHLILDPNSIILIQRIKLYTSNAQ